MKMIRTTITMPEKMHKEIKYRSVQKGISLNDYMLSKLSDSPEYSYTTPSEKIQKAHAFFDRVGKIGPAIDVVKAVREERENGHG